MLPDGVRPTTLRTSIMKQYGCSTYSSVEYTEVTRFIVPPAS